MKKIILDVDTGVDDAQAILLALRSPELQVEAFTTVSGNVHVDQTSENTLKILELAKVEDIPVAKGAAIPMLAEPQFAEFAHGDDGLGNVGLPPPEIELSEKNAVDTIIDIVMANPGEITLVPVGPFTNIAIAILKEPRLIENVEEVVIMGGCYGVTPYGYGNMTAVAEFNVWADPEAASIMFQSGLKITAVGIDISQNPANCLKEEHLKQFAQVKTTITDFVINLSRFRMRSLGGVSRLHDPIAVAVTLDRSIAKTETFHVDVETMGKFTRGMTVADRRAQWRRDLLKAEKGNIEICTWIDGEKFLNLFIDRLSK